MLVHVWGGCASHIRMLCSVWTWEYWLEGHLFIQNWQSPLHSLSIWSLYGHWSWFQNLVSTLGNQLLRTCPHNSWLSDKVRWGLMQESKVWLKTGPGKKLGKAKGNLPAPQQATKKPPGNNKQSLLPILTDVVFLILRKETGSRHCKATIVTFLIFKWSS